eukprot:scpid43312/ scgid9600/ 
MSWLDLCLSNGMARRGLLCHVSRSEFDVPLLLLLPVDPVERTLAEPLLIRRPNLPSVERRTEDITEDYGKDEQMAAVIRSKELQWISRDAYNCAHLNTTVAMRNTPHRT